METKRVRSKVRTVALAWCSVYLDAHNEYTTTKPPDPEELPFSASLNDRQVWSFIIGLLGAFFGFLFLMIVIHKLGWTE